MQHDRASKKQQELLQFVDNFIKANGYGPSYREIMRGLGYKSVSTVAIHIDNLITKGYLFRRDKSARSLEVVRQSAAPNSSPDLEAMLKKHIDAHQLSVDQRRVVAEAMKTLGFSKLAEQLGNPDEKDKPA
ncbi:MAG TPA: hypothetical protein PK096_00015 [Candidatus Saccharibacteria bacterium]|nr:hypothetical protein [Candidatus Saccharibacteria bacterium]